MIRPLWDMQNLVGKIGLLEIHNKFKGYKINTKEYQQQSAKLSVVRGLLLHLKDSKGSKIK